MQRFTRGTISPLDQLIPKFLRGLGVISCYSTSTDAAEIKTGLRNLYKQVHPDLFHSLPEAQKANEKSFKLLQEYLMFGKEGGPFGQSAGVPYRFEFFLRQKQKDAAELDTSTSTSHAEPGDSDEPGKSRAEEVRKVSVVLPPPGRLGGHTAGSGDMPVDLQRSVAKLLNACGFETSIKELESPAFHAFSEVPDDYVFTREKLSEFVVEAAEMVRQNANRQFGPRQQLSAVRTALKIGRQVKADFTGTARNEDAAVKLRLLQQLATALDKAPEDVTGLTFLIGDAYGSDKRGRIRLDRQDDGMTWTGYMWQIDLRSCRESQQTLAALKRLEASVAVQLGLGLVFSDEHLALEDKYRRCLEALASHGVSQGAIFAPAASNVALRVADDSVQSESYSVDTEGGALVVPVGGPAENIYSYCQTHGPGLLDHLHRQKEEQDQMENLRHNTERRLLLKQLSLDPKVSRARLRSACLRLTQGAETLKGLLDGLSIRISHVNQVSGDSSYIDVAWNFEV